MTDHIKALAADFKAKLAVAVAAEKRLIEAQDRADLPAPKQIFTGADIKMMRREWHDEWMAMLPVVVKSAIANATGNQPAAMTSEGILRAGRLRRGENVVDLKPTGMSAQILAAAAKRDAQ